MGKYIVTASIVTYHNQNEVLIKTINCALANLKGISDYLFIIDNSKNDNLSVLCDNSKIIYIKNKENIGFGSAHNIAIKKSIELNSDYHLILNPDVVFEDNVIDKLASFMESYDNVGLVMPKIRYPNGELQYLCKLLPTPFDLFFRRFLPFRNIIEKRNNKYELKFTGYNKIMEVPALSGCFMFTKTSILKVVEGFDENFFMYAEDIDLCRRIGRISKTIFYPKIEIIHNYEKGSYKNLKLLKYHIISLCKYFSKWGWFWDNDRKLINKRTIIKLKSMDSI